MRILYGVTGRVYGGAVAHVLGLMRADIAAGTDVSLVSAPGQRLMQEACDMGARVFPNPYFVHGVHLLQDIRALWPVFQAVRKFNPDIISAHSTKAGYAARLAGALLKKPVIFTAHGWSFTEGRNTWQRPLLVMAERLAAWKTAVIICVSNHDRELALKFKIAPPGKLMLIHNGVNPSPLLNANGERVRRELVLGNVPVCSSWWGV